jgi:hypothetical protein
MMGTNKKGPNDDKPSQLRERKEYSNDETQ